MWGIGGAAVGVLFSAIVAWCEGRCARQARVWPVVAGAVVATIAVTWALVEVEFGRRELLPPFALEGAVAAIAGGLALGLSVSRRAGAEPAAPDYCTLLVPSAALPRRPGEQPVHE
ncbi:hypothetical protein [Frigoriglobus tundricola]|uniref:Uncharacterized protein n=1 Tax=Frigoriglobus tundricola TaxID=2774151 RepID=A0A6M5Z0C1_9BACT|nr:hypothetical protein [Frigoriglobus tundricola]QJW99769.1 hypothetical protein FTUN_7392 [Frigoriglobus tundricola]